MSRLLTSLFVCAGVAFASSAGAAAMTKESYNAEMDKIKAEYKADREHCSGMSGNAKDVCVEMAKGKEKVAKAEADAAYKGTEKARYDARLAHAEADYAVAKEKCDDFSGNAKDVCVKEAKAAEVKAKANAKVAHVANDASTDASNKRADASRNAMEDKRDADYKVAVEKCDSLSGDAKDQCVKNAKVRFGKS